MLTGATRQLPWPPTAVPGVLHSELLDEVPLDMVRYLVEEVARPSSQLMMIEVRQHGSGYAREPEIPNAVGIRPRGFWFNAVAAAMPPGGRAAAGEQLQAVREGVSKWATGELLPNRNIASA